MHAKEEGKGTDPDAHTTAANCKLSVCGWWSLGTYKGGYLGLSSIGTYSITAERERAITAEQHTL